MTKVLVVDDHESMRESLERLFNESGDFCVVGGISCADHAVRMCGELSPDIVFMDVCTEGGASGLRATKEVRDAFPDIKVIVMTAFDEISYAPRAKEAGAHAFIYKSRSLSEFEQTARDVMSGGGCFPEPKTIPMPQASAADGARNGDTAPDVQAYDQQRDCRRALYQRGHGEVPQEEYARKNRLRKVGRSRFLHDIKRVDKSALLTILPFRVVRILFCFVIIKSAKYFGECAIK